LESETQVSVGVFSPAQHFRVMKRRIANLPTPVFVINRFAFERNCKTMLEMVRGKGLLLRPHVKTHRTAEGARIQANAERETNVLVTGFVASTLPEVKMLVESKYDLPRDILYGVPIFIERGPDSRYD
jgi:D-serine deaminase-like pyridoxal phosphate-dependent protein